MITISRNKNFSEWLDIRLFGKLIDNTKTEAFALKIATEEKRKLAERGERVLIVKEGESTPCEK